MKNNIEKIRRKLRLSIDDIAPKLGMTFQNFRNIELGKTELRKKYEEELIKIFNCSINDLYDENIDINNLNDKKQNKFIPIKYYDLSASAGNGCFTDIENYEVINIGEDFLNKIGIINYNNIAIIKAKGSSMFPTIQDGDFLFVDINKKEIFNDKIYIINEKGFLKVKRVLIESPFAEEITIKSDNHISGEYPPYNIKIDGLENVVCGMVVFFCRSL